MGWYRRTLVINPSGCLREWGCINKHHRCVCLYQILLVYRQKILELWGCASRIVCQVTPCPTCLGAPKPSVWPHSRQVASSGGRSPLKRRKHPSFCLFVAIKISTGERTSVQNTNDPPTHTLPFETLSKARVILTKIDISGAPGQKGPAPVVPGGNGGGNHG